MCGIAGLLNLNGAPADQNLALRMASRLSHRGPDAEGVWTEGPVTLSHRRLAIRDLSGAAAQPFASQCGRVVIVYNGEIYNDESIAKRLARETGFQCRTSSDTEIIPAAYLAWGLKAFEIFEGMFAISLWDRQTQRLILARDGIGIKPLYVMETPSRIAFASEIKALRLLGTGAPKLSAPDLAHMLSQGYPAPTRSTIRDIRQVPPGTLLVHEKGSTREQRFWSPSRQGQVTEMCEAVPRLMDTLREVVSDQLISDVDIGSLQSGGIDSSLITLSLPTTRNVQLFSVSFPERSHDESANVQALAAAAGRNVNSIRLNDSVETSNDFVACALAVDGQLGDASMLATYQLSREVRRHVKVALSGDGGDEFFGGYSTYRATVHAERIKSFLPRGLARIASAQLRNVMVVRDSRQTLAEKLYRLIHGFSHVVPHGTWRHYLPNDERENLYGPELLDQMHMDPFAGYADAFRNAAGGTTDKAMLADQTYYLPADMLTKVDRASMAHGLEVRVPLLDRRVMDLAGSLHPNLLFGSSGTSTKLILRKVLQLLGGPKQLVRGPKLGFNIPINMLLRGAIRPLAERYLNANADFLEPFLRPDGVRNIWRQHIGGLVDRKYSIWTLLTIAVWLDMEGTT